MANGFRRAHFLNIPEVSSKLCTWKADCKSKSKLHQIAKTNQISNAKIETDEYRKKIVKIVFHNTLAKSYFKILLHSCPCKYYDNRIFIILHSLSFMHRSQALTVLSCLQMHNDGRKARAFIRIVRPALIKKVCKEKHEVQGCYM